ncbi:MAG TPA: matrixin family metalloprotease [Patescibacteria group bacterium]|nr:matrixin family metalloprotease [Patescibacteria group bacterium]
MWNAIEGTCYTFNNKGDLGFVLWIDSRDVWDAIPANENAIGALKCDFYSYFIVYLNVAYFADSKWDASCTTGKFDIQTIVAHEFGHALGLGDASSCVNSIMWPSIGTGSYCRQDLSAEDKQAIKSMCDDPAGSICYFLPVYKDGVVEITWEIVDHEADHYYLERSNAAAEKFERIPEAEFVPDRTRNPGTYVYVDAKGTAGSIYRLMEEDIHGNTYVHDIEQAMMPFEYIRDIEPDFNPDELYKELEQWASMSKVNREVALRAQSVTEDWVAIGPVEYIDSPGVLALAYWHEQYGLTTGITILQHIEDYWDGDLKAYLNYLHEHGTRYVMLVGDANDHELWDDPAVWSVNGWGDFKPDLISQPAYDIIPADYFLDHDPRETNMAYFTP